MQNPVDPRSSSGLPADLEIAVGAVAAAQRLSGLARPSVTRNATVMGGPFVVTAVGGDPKTADRMLGYLRRLELLWSRFRADSEISQLNAAEGKSVAVSSETLTLVGEMIAGWKRTEGKYDPTTLPLTLARGYVASRTNAKLSTVLPASAIWPGDVDGIQINLDESVITLPIGTTLDPGGIGKGLAADLAVALALEMGASGAMVNCNGDVVVSGESPDGDAWRIGIEHPLLPDEEIEQVCLTRGAVVTSSTHYQKWEAAGQQTHHLSDPATGDAAETEVMAASVIAASGAKAETLAKLPFLMDVDAAMSFIENNSAAACIVEKDLTEFLSASWANYRC